jgi:serpin B
MLPYDDNKLAYLAVMPPEDTKLGDYISQLDGNTIGALMKSAEKIDLKFNIPKYTVYFDAELNDMLGRMGLSIAFDENNADFSRMGTAAGRLSISRILHKTFFKINELGTEAAAATSVQIRCQATPISNQMSITFNRPFFYALVDRNTDLPIFLGTVDVPPALE